jgi:hypothetical protein
MSDNPFRGRTKQLVIRTKAEVLEQIKLHRRMIHDTDDLDEFFDCGTCGVLEHRWKEAIDVKGEK